MNTFSRYFFFLFILISLAISPASTVKSQAVGGDTATYPFWIEMMQDPQVNFFEVQRAFESYWKDRPVTRSSGWKPFKRWEYMMSLRVSPTGERPSPDKPWKEYWKYQNSQKQLTDPAGNWTELGPQYLPINGSGLGRLNAIAFHPADDNIIYVGAPSGGLWKSVDGGQFWTSNTDHLPTLGVSSILVDYSNPEILYIGTGDRDAGDAHGIGVMKSTDGGQLWNLSNNGMGNVIVGKMLMHPVDHLLVYAATSDGIYRSYNGGDSWDNISPGAGNYKDLVFKPGDPNTIYAARAGLLFKSSDAGTSWVPLTNGLPGAYRGVIGVSPADPEIIYFLQSNSDSYKGLYRSADGGASFTEQSTSPNILSWGCNGGSGGQGWYDLCVAVDPLNPDIIYAGGVNIFKSVDKGQTWQISAHWWGDCDVAFTHADQHVFEWNPLNGRLYVGNDGGCFSTSDGGNEWMMISQGLAVAQVYKIGQSATVKNLVMNGYQDNGSACFADTTWRTVMGGDGMECAIDPSNPLYKYGTVYYGRVSRIYNFTNQGDIAGNGINGINEEGAWVSPFILHETDPNTMFLGLKSVWRSNNIKNLSTSTVNWTKISSNFGSGNCRALEQSPANPAMLYLIKESGKLVRTDNANAAVPVWTDLTLNLPAGISNISDIEAHPVNPNWAYLSSNGKVYKTTDKGVSWDDFSGSLPDVFFSGIAYCKGSQEGLYLSSDIGVFYRDASLEDWIPFSQGLPAASRVTEIELFYDAVDPDNNSVRAGTYGRGLWESPFYQSQPIAAFTSDFTTVPGNCNINFTDLSFGFPTSWQWTFQGGNPATSNQQNPQNISFSDPGPHDVTLVISNSIGSDTLTLPGYITVSSSLLPNPGFYASDSLFCSGQPVVSFYDTSIYCPTTWLWTFTPASVTFLNGTTASSQNPVVQFNADGQYTVTLTVGNINGSIDVSKPGMILIGGKPLPFTDDFESGKLSGKAWSVENPNNDNTWEIWNTGGNPPGTWSARMKIFSTNTMGRRDRLITPPLDLTGLDHASLQFKHAYCQYQVEYTDTLILMASDNCGQSWTVLYKGFDDGSGSFATRPPLVSNFIPSVTSDWCGSDFGSPCLSVDLSLYAGKKNVRIAFESVSFISNNIYLDDINIAQSSGIAGQSFQNGLRMYPNPASASLYVSSTEKMQQINIFDLIGNTVDIIKVNDYEAIVDVSKLRNGIYGLKVVSKHGVVFRMVQVVK